MCPRPLQVLSLHDLPKAMPYVGWTADPCALIPPIPEVEPPTVDEGLEGVPGHRYAHILAGKLRAGSLSIDTADHLVEAAADAAMTAIAEEDALREAAAGSARGASQ